MTASATAFRIAFPTSPDPLNFGRRLGRLRWRRALAAHFDTSPPPEATALDVFSSGDWAIVLCDTAVPVCAVAPAVGNGRVVFAEALAVRGDRAVHTLREIESASPAAFDPVRDGSVPAVAFSTSDFPPSPDETVDQFLARLLDSRTPRESVPGFAALLAPDAFGFERPEVTRWLSSPIRRLLDVGCGAGRASAAVKKRFSGLTVTGIEKDSGAAARARAVLDSVFEEDAATGLARLLVAGERFDAFLFADVLEHLEDPLAVLAQARALALPGASLVASVPNVGHLSLARDLLLGRFDPLPAGLADAGHLRWFTRGFLAEALIESGWSVDSVHSVEGAPPPEGASFLEWFSAWTGLDRTSLAAYQWIAVARAGPA